jgi:REP element-mobilizing transposase RayT
MHHVTCRSIAEEHIFKDGGDYATGIALLAELVSRDALRCHAFCFMPTHYHVFGTFSDLSDAIHELNRRYAVAFNRRYRRRGHVFDSPFFRKPVESEGYLRDLVRYVALNPPDPEHWPYASYPGLIGTGEPFSFVDPEPILEVFGTIEGVREFVNSEPGSEAF